MHSYASGLHWSLQLTEKTMAMISEITGYPVYDVKLWLGGAPIPIMAQRDIALALDLPRWCFTSNAFAAFEAGFRANTPHYREGYDDPIVMYWGNAGLMAPGMKEPLWLPIDEMESQTIDLNSDYAAVIRGIGMSVAAVFPSRMNAICMIQAKDLTSANREQMSLFDPMNGVSDEVKQALMETDFYRDEVGAPCDGIARCAPDQSDRSSKYCDRMDSLVYAMGCPDDVRKFSERTDIFMTDGSHLTMPTEAVSGYIADFFEELEMGMQSEAFDVMVKGSRYFFPAERISMIRTSYSHFWDRRQPRVKDALLDAELAEAATPR